MIDREPPEPPEPPDPTGPARPACIARLPTPQGGEGEWTERELLAMDAAFVAAVRTAHPELLE